MGLIRRSCEGSQGVRARLGLVSAFLLGACFSASTSSVAGDAKQADAKQADAKQDAPAGDAKAGGAVDVVASVVAAADAPHRQAPGGKADVWMLARGRNAFLARLEMAAGGAVPEHRDATEEYLYVLEGSGTLTIDDVDHEVTPGTAIFMPANAKVRYQNGDAKLVAVQVFAGPAPAAKYDAWTKVSGE